MLNIVFKLISLSLTVMCLSSCMMDGTRSNSGYSPFDSADTPQSLYPEGYDTIDAYNQPTDPSSSSTHVIVPQSYHVGVGTPESARHVDNDWVTRQNPQTYTIEIAGGDKASHVASKLYKVPKNERTAEVQTHDGRYTGLYGSYSTYQAAQDKLNALPDDIKQGAEIKTWSTVQSDL